MFTWSLYANEDRAYFECPCTLKFDGDESFELTAGFRNFGKFDLTNMRVRVNLKQHRYLKGSSIGTLASIDIEETLPTGGALIESTFKETNAPNITRAGEFYVVLELVDGNGTWHDSIFMKEKVSPSSEFTIDFLDYLIDSDEDGVGDLNETLEGTDPDSASSTPGDSVIDVVALYGESFAKEYDWEPSTRIQHVFELANDIFEDSGVPIKWRIVGMVQVEVNDQKDDFDDKHDLVVEGERHGSDLTVLFSNPESHPSCGFGGLFGVGRRGEMTDVDLTYAYARVWARRVCTGWVLAHEMGHILGLGHSEWQNEVGAWRWSRGHHAEDGSFKTLMSYPRDGTVSRIDVFSDPDADCGAEDLPCGVEHDQRAAADAVTHLNTVRFQYARFRASFPDTDDDGFVDPVDTFPDDGGEWVDTDDDGIGNNTDTDDDGDGYADDVDVFPLDSAEWADTDGDGYGDNGDVFPEDPTEWVDSDNDGYGDNSDVFPLDPEEWLDTDNDGVGDNSDAFPDDVTEWTDTDDDGVGNNADPDDDGDGVPDTDDAYSQNANRSDFFSYKFLVESNDDRLTSVVSFRASKADSADTHVLIGVPDLFDDGINRGGAYIVNIKELDYLDSMDGSTDRVASLSSVLESTQCWKLVGSSELSRAGDSVAIGDVDGDGSIEIIVSAPHEDHGGANSGSLYVLPFKHLDDMDTDDDRLISLDMSGIEDYGWRLDGNTENELATGNNIAVADIDADGADDLLVGTYLRTLEDTEMLTVAYFIPGGTFEELDASDEANDRIINLYESVGPKTTRIILSDNFSNSYSYRASVDLSGRGDQNILIGHPTYGENNKGAAFALSRTMLSAADTADNTEDGRINLSHVASLDDSWQISEELSYSRLGQNVAFVDDFSGDGKQDLFMGEYLDLFFVASQDLNTLDTADGVTDGNILIRSRNFSTGNSLWLFIIRATGNIANNSQSVVISNAFLNSWTGTFQFELSNILSLARTTTRGGEYIFASRIRSQIRHLQSHRSLIMLGTGASFMSTTDDDERDELLVTAPGDRRDSKATSVLYLLSSQDLAELDSRASENGNLILIEDLWGDHDNDGLKNFADIDDDNDYVFDINDRFHLDDSESEDSDADGFGDNFDAFPRDSREYLDTDEDGVGNNADDDDDNDGIIDVDDTFPLDTDNDGVNNDQDSDDDGDGVLDSNDAFPYDSSEWMDTDDDGVGNNEDVDDDNDGVEDDLDAFPLDSTETTDSDGDGTGDNSDAFPDDPDEWLDTDGDGIGNNEDTDDDGDAVADEDDQFPLDASRSVDSDGDGVADDDDAFPNDPSEWSDFDEDGTGDNSDPDLDNDGVLNVDDEFPKDRTRVDLRSVTFLPWNLGADVGAQAGRAGNTDHDTKTDLLLSGQGVDERNFVYLVSSSVLVSLDANDGNRDGKISDHFIPTFSDSWKIMIPEGDEGILRMLRVGELTDDPVDSFFVSTSRYLAGDAYVIYPADIEKADENDDKNDGIVALIDIPGRGNSWRFESVWYGAEIGFSASYIEDVDGDERPDICISAPNPAWTNLPGSVFIASSSSLPVLDHPRESSRDGVISLEGVTENFSRLDEEHRVWVFTGESGQDWAGSSVASGDFDSDGLADVVIGAREHDHQIQDSGAVYLVGSKDWASGDRADNTEDRHVNLGSVSSLSNSWKFVGGSADQHLGQQVVVDDLNRDSILDLIVVQNGRVDVLSARNFSNLDSADGNQDGVVIVSDLKDGDDSWQIDCPSNWTGCNVATFDGPKGSDSRSIAISVKGSSRDSTITYLISRENFEVLDDLDDSQDRKLIHLFSSDLVHSYALQHPRVQSRVETDIAEAGDFDGDGQSDLIVTIKIPRHPSETYLISSAELEYLDQMDREVDGVINLLNVTVRQRSQTEVSE